ncbi:MAG: serine/threonine protein kinase, partial [Candidatus Latescibacteria bacterium]|nr:serine/threonine protein kinase [Candidatus Latescibacterota bacterium]
METTKTGEAILALIKELQDTQRFKDLNWEGTFEDYLEIVHRNPQVARTAFQRIYDMILSHGTEKITDGKEEIIRYRFFIDPEIAGEDAVFGLDRQLMYLVHMFKSAARRYGIEKRVLLLHGPVGSSKSTIVRRLKKGLEEYSHTEEGAAYTFGWRKEEKDGTVMYVDCPMHEEPLHLIPQSMRAQALGRLNEGRRGEEKLEIEGDLCPFCRFMYNDLTRRYEGDWTRVVEHIRVHRLILSEKDRIGIGTFQPKDEKNQDSTELTGDINYRKIAEYGADSDPRAFNFDGEFNIANRGLVEFIEVLKLDVAFLYDLLGASQEHSIKPKKFSQIDIDEVIIGHSVAGPTPILYRYEGTPGWTTLAQLYERFAHDASGLEILAYDFDDGRACWTPVRSLFRHRFTGNLLTTAQKWGAVETTPNHSIYGRDGQPFYPEDRHEIMAVRHADDLFGPVEDMSEVAVVAGIDGFVQDDVHMAAGGGRMTRPCQPGWARLDLPRHATAIQALVHPLHDADALNDLITVLVWYATEGHVNGRNGGIVISQANREELERVRAAYAHITTGRGVIDEGAQTDSVWRLYLGSEAIARLATHHCGEHAVNKRLPDFIFSLPHHCIRHAFDELMRTDGSRRLSAQLDRTASLEYRAQFFEFKTLSPMLAAQVGTLATLLGYDYSVYYQERPDRSPVYRIRFVSGTGKRGGRHDRFEAHLHTRSVENEWVYDIECVGLHNFICGVGNVVCHNTNEPEYRKLQNDEFMEALRDRTAKVDIPYVTRLSDEIKIYDKDYNLDKVKGKHIAPHTIEMAAMWTVLTRLEEPKEARLTILQKLKLYNGKTLPGFTEDNIKELRAEAPREGMEGISPRYIQDKISNALVSDFGEGCVNPFMVLNELEHGLDHHSLITSEEQKRRYRELLTVVKEEYEDIVKNEVQRAISADEEAIGRLCANYIDNIKAYTQKEKVKNRYTGQDE